MMLAAKLDDLGGPAWIALTVVGFLIWWPLGLVAVAAPSPQQPSPQQPGPEQPRWMVGRAVRLERQPRL
jgi:hypothetical protein